MSKKGITGFGLFACMMMCSSFAGLMYASFSGEVDLLAYALAQAAVAAAGAIAALLFFKPKSSHSAKLKKLNTPLRGVCVLLTLLMTFVLMIDYALFLGSFTHISGRFYGYFAVLLLVSIFSARKGIAALTRCAAIFFITVGVLDAAELVLLSLRFNLDEVKQATVSAENLTTALAFACLQLVPLPVFAVFREKLPTNRRKPLLLWSVLSPAFTAAWAFLTLGALGDYAQYVRFPFYTASQTIAAGTFRRLDGVFLCTRMTGAFLLLSTAICAAFGF